eukprot:TRINITY_DN66425_c10_g11_i1.p1 TRINITY_DN66425_c10_g11~~TRINITY_DN66425_c10_g11_i1.p1  ORF type:complete len:510 (-),score=99.92 TRINITY_DN66425_c10_g11_i1:226-1560(-)
MDTSSTTTTPTDGNGKAAVHSVWLFTDGLVNAGDTSPDVIQQKAEKLLRSCPQPVSVHTFGYGTSHNAELLRNIAEVGHGMYYYVENAEQIGEAFVECLGGLLSVVAQNLRVIIKSVPGSEVQEVYTTFKAEKVDGAWQVSISDMFAEEHRDILCRVKVNSLPMAVNEASIISCEVQYEDALADAKKECASGKCCIARPENATPLSEQVVPHILDQQRNRIKTMQVFEQARQAADCGDFSLAQNLVCAQRLAVSSSSSAPTPYTHHLIAELDGAASSFAPAVYATSGQKAILQSEGMWKNERSAGKPSQPMFRNSKQAALGAAFKPQQPTPVQQPPPPPTPQYKPFPMPPPPCASSACQPMQPPPIPFNAQQQQQQPQITLPVSLSSSASSAPAPPRQQQPQTTLPISLTSSAPQPQQQQQQAPFAFESFPTPPQQPSPVVTPC